MLWMTRTVIVIFVAALAACGGSPTSPTPGKPPITQSTGDASGSNPAPNPGPSRIVLHAVVENAHWYPNATFTLPERFDVIVEGETVKIATLEPLPFSLREANDRFIVKTREFEFSVQGRTFSFNGLAGQASGRISQE